MLIIKRDGTTEEVSFDKILRRVRILGKLAPEVKINFTTLVMKVIDQLCDEMSTSKIDEIMAQECANMVSVHPDYHLLAARVIISNHHKMTSEHSSSFSDVMSRLDAAGILSSTFYSVVQEHGPELDAICDYSRDYLIDYFGFKTLEKTYLLRTSSSSSPIMAMAMERPQHLFLRVAVALHGRDLTKVKETYDGMSLKKFIHATPTLFNAGTRTPQLSSCYLIGIENDSVDGIYNTLKDCAAISKWSGGIGMHIHEVRATGSPIKGTNGVSSGIVPMLRVFNQTAKYINQGGKRNGSMAIYLEPWHADIELFLQMRKNHGEEELKARDLFYGLWIPDLFMRRVKEDREWTLFCPHAFPGLNTVYGAEFEALYASYESAAATATTAAAAKNRKGAAAAAAIAGSKTVRARDLWFQILDAQMETGTPYLCYKDAANRKSNQKNIGTIQSSNLCTEIMQFSDGHETAVCNLASVALPAFVDPDTLSYDFAKLHEVVRIVTNNLNRVIDINFYPTAKTSSSNYKHRPIGIGVQGLADVFLMLNLPFVSDEAKLLNRRIFETIYHAALTESCDLAARDGAYESFAGSPAAEGKLQFDLWNIEMRDRDTPPPPPPTTTTTTTTTNVYDDEEWERLRQKIVRDGLRNSVLVAPMPTASTSQILGYNECFEPITSNIFSRRTIAGEFILVNQYLMKELIALNLWNEPLKNDIILHNGSVQHIECIPAAIKQKYLTVWELPMREVIDMAADRAQFICQSQSLNLWVKDPDYAVLTSMHFYAWSKGLKTGMYYLRRRASSQVQKFSIQVQQFAPTPIPIPAPADAVCESCTA